MNTTCNITRNQESKTFSFSEAMKQRGLFVSTDKGDKDYVLFFNHKDNPIIIDSSGKPLNEVIITLYEWETSGWTDCTFVRFDGTITIKQNA